MTYQRMPILPRPCRQCGKEFAPAHPNGAICSDACRRRRALDSAARWEKANPERCRQTDQAWRDRNREHYRASKNARRAKNAEHYRAKRREFYQAHKEQEREAYRVWQAKNRAQRTAYMHEWERRRAAIADGKSRPLDSENGFLLVRARSGFWRAAACGQRIGASEQIMARYEQVRYKQVQKRWYVFAPTLATDAQRQLAARLNQLEEKQLGQKIVRRFSTLKAEAA